MLIQLGPVWCACASILHTCLYQFLLFPSPPLPGLVPPDHLPPQHWPGAGGAGPADREDVLLSRPTESGSQTGRMGRHCAVVMVTAEHDQ